MLTDKAIPASIRAAKAADKALKRFDEKGLYLLCKPNGSALWRFKYAFGGSEKLIALGAYPDVSLKRAREKRDEARELVADGQDPSAIRKAKRAATADTVAAIAEEYLAREANAVTEGTTMRRRQRLDAYVLPYVGHKPITTVTPPELLAVLRKVEARGKLDTAKRCRELCSCIWRFAIAMGRAERDIAADLRGALAAPVTEHLAAITEPHRVGELLRAIDSYRGQPATSVALRLTPLVFVRPGELRTAEWCEFEQLDGLDPTWRIPAAKMKMRDPHLVPLSTQAVDVLREIRPLTGSGKYVFPSLRTGARPMSNNTVNAALRRLGYSGDEQVAHGFRATASSLLNELGWAPDLIELQLAHKERNKSRAAYNRSQRLEERRKMMQAWADYLDGLRAGGNVVAIGSKHAA